MTKQPPEPWGFITVQHPDEMKSRVNRRAIHQHVMRAHGPSRRNPASKRIVKQRPAKGLTTAAQLTEPTPSSPTVEAALGLPTERRAHELSRFLFRQHSAFCMKVRELCFSLALFDDGAYHLALAEMALHGDISAAYTLPHAEDVKSLQHYDRAVAHINQRMQSHQPYQIGSYEILGVVLGLASYDVSVGNIERWKTHMAGLELLINSRGGLEYYPSAYFQLSLLWTETTGALVMDRAPRFDIPLSVMQPYCKPVSNPILDRNLAKLRNLDPQLGEIASIMELMTGLAQSFKRQAGQGDDETDEYQVYCITRARTSYLLLQVERADTAVVMYGLAPKAMVLCQTIRLAILTLLLRFVGYAPGTTSYHPNRLLELLECHDQHWSELPELQLWVLTVAAVMMKRTDNRQTSLVRRISALMQNLGVSWDELPETLDNIVWVHSLLDCRLLELETMLE